MDSSTEKRSYNGYVGAMYRGYIKEGLRAGLPVEEVIQMAQEMMDSIPKLDIEDENPLAADYLGSQNKEAAK